MINPFRAAGLAATLPAPRTVPIGSALPLQPQIEAWTDHQLDGLVWSDILGIPTEDVPLSRAAAMAVPAIARARHLTAGTIAKMPLQQLAGDVVTPVQPYWCQGSNGQLGDLADDAVRRLGVGHQSTWWRSLWTIDDLIFYGVSVWLVTRFYDTGKPAELARLPRGAWNWNDDGDVTDQDGQAIDNRLLRIIPGPHEGILNFAQRTIRGATDLERTAADVARRPFRVLIHQTTDITLDPLERQAIIGDVRRALRDNDGVLFTNAALEATAIPIDSSALLIDGRNAAALDIARDVSMPAAMLDASTPGASLEYATLQGRNQHWIDYGLSLYMEALTARLSMDDVVTQGNRVALDVSDLTSPVPGATGPTRED